MKVRSRYESAAPSRASRLFYGFVRAAVALVCRLLFRLEVHGRENIPPTGSFVLAPGAHRSNLETPFAACITRRRMRFMGKDSLWKYGFSAWLLSALGGYPVHRTGADREALRLTMEIIDGGEPVVMFPEGTRGTGPKVGEMHDGPVYVAARKQVPIVPVGMGGSERAMAPGKKLIRPTKVVIVVGEPIDPPPPTEAGRVPRKEVRAATDRLRDRIQELFDEAQARAGA